MPGLDWLTTEPYGQTTLQLGELALALVLSSLIGLEREFRMKSAGLRTHTLVGVAAALIMLISKYGFTDVISKYIVLDPSRVAAQIVTGIGFIGGGLIFVHRDIVRGLTTAAVIWLTAAVGMACGAGLPLLAVFVTGIHFLVVYGYTPITRRILSERAELLIEYVPGGGVVQGIIDACTGCGFMVRGIAVQQQDAADGGEKRAIQLLVEGRRRSEELVVSVGDIKGVTSVRMTPTHHPKD
jgi:putative Mg2+ transporter-C (MgtC) family protein